MTYDELVEAMAKDVHESMCKQAIIEYLDNPFDASAIASNALSAINALGLAVVPRDATEAEIKAGVHKALSVSISGEYPWTAYMRELRAVMISAGEIKP